MSTLVYTYNGDGHRPVVSPDGQKVAWGDENLKVVHVPNPEAIWVIGPGRDIRFLNNDVVTWVKILSSNMATRYTGSLSAFDGGQPTSDDPTLVAGNDFYAGNNAWASVLVEHRRLTYRSNTLGFEKRNVRKVRMCGRWMVTIEIIEDGSEVFAVYEQGTLVRVHGLPQNANDYKVSSEGWITYGYYGTTWLLTPNNVIHNITVTPHAQEFPACLVHLPNSVTWAWTSTVFESGEPAVIGRPLILGTDGFYTSQKQCAILHDFPAEGVNVGWWSEFSSFTVAGSANLGNNTPLQVHVVPLTHALEEMENQKPILDTSGEAVNLWNFIIPDRQYWPRTSKRGHDMDVAWDGENFWTLPFGQPNHWVRFTIKDGVMTLIEDHSKDGQNTGDWSITKGVWLKQFMVPKQFGGEVIEHPDNWLVRYAANSCDIVHAHLFRFKTYLYQHWLQYYCGLDLGWQEVIVTACDLGSMIEFTYWAKGGRSLFRFQAASADDFSNLFFENWFELLHGPHILPTPGCWKPEHLNINSWPIGEEEVNKPGVQITHFDPRIAPGIKWVLKWEDRENTELGYKGEVEILPNGSVHIKLQNAKGEDRSVNARIIRIG